MEGVELEGVANALGLYSEKEALGSAAEVPPCQSGHLRAAEVLVREELKLDLGPHLLRSQHAAEAAPHAAPRHKGHDLKRRTLRAIIE